MSEENNNQENANVPAIVINTQYVKDLSLEIPFAPEIFREINSAPKWILMLTLKPNICMTTFLMCL